MGFDARAAAARSPASTKIAFPSSSARGAFCQLAQVDERDAFLQPRLGDEQLRALFVRLRSGAQRRRQRPLEIRERAWRRSIPPHRCADPPIRRRPVFAGRPASRARPCPGPPTSSAAGEPQTVLDVVREKIEQRTVDPDRLVPFVANFANVPFDRQPVLARELCRTARTPCSRRPPPARRSRARTTRRRGPRRSAASSDRRRARAGSTCAPQDCRRRAASAALPRTSGWLPASTAATPARSRPRRSTARRRPAGREGARRSG